MSEDEMLLVMTILELLGNPKSPNEITYAYGEAKRRLEESRKPRQPADSFRANPR